MGSRVVTPRPPDFSPVEYFRFIRRRWLVLMGGAFFGAFVGLVAGATGAPQYEAAALLSVDLGNRQTEGITYAVEARALDRVAAIIESDNNLKVALELLPESMRQERGFNGVDDIYPRVSLQRVREGWRLLTMDRDPHSAALISNAWANASLATLDEATSYGKQGRRLLGGGFRIRCLDLLEIEPEGAIEFQECRLIPPKLEPSAFSGELVNSVELSRGVFPGILYELAAEATFPSRVSVLDNSRLIVAGSISGVLVSLVGAEIWELQSGERRRSAGSGGGKKGPTGEREAMDRVPNSPEPIGPPPTILAAWANHVSYRRLLSIIGLALIGGAIPMLSWFLRSAQYEAATVLAVNVNYNTVDVLDPGGEDRLLNQVSELLVSDKVLERALAKLDETIRNRQGWNDPASLREAIRLERNLSQWRLIVTDSEPNIGIDTANAWAEGSIEFLDEAVGHAWSAVALEGAGIYLTCDKRGYANPADRGLPWECSAEPFTGGHQDLGGALAAEAALSFGLPPVVSYEWVHKATEAKSQVAESRGLAVLLGAVIGGLLGLAMLSARDRSANPSRSSG